MLWRSTMTSALLRLPSANGRRQTYANYVRKLYVQAYHTSVVHCCFPQLRSLRLPGFSACHDAEMLRNCGPLLTSIRIRYPFATSTPDEYTSGPPLCATELAMLAQLPALVYLSTEDISLLSWGESYNTDTIAAAADVLNAIENPFTALRKLRTEMYARAMPLLLPLVGRLTELLVEVDDPFYLHILPAVASSVPLLQVLHLKFLDHGRHCGIDISDLLELRRLVHLRKLIIDAWFADNGAQSLTVDQWTTLVGGLPRLEYLVMPQRLGLPASALGILGANCRRLSKLTMRSRCSLEVLGASATVSPSFPELNDLSVEGFDEPGADER
jgi:hypothetical protein